MGKLEVGLGLWYPDLQIIIDGFMYNRNPNLKSNDYSRPDHSYWPDALELQIESVALLTTRGNRRCFFEPRDFDANATQKFFEDLSKKKIKDFYELSDLATESSIHRTLDWIRSKPHRGVHSSDGVYDPQKKKKIMCDLATPDSRTLDLSLNKYRSLMYLAQAIDATSFIIHPTSVDHVDGKWLGLPETLEERAKRKQNFTSSFRTLLQIYKTSRSNFPICIENLEFPKFPATSQELIQMYSDALKIAQEENILQEKIKVCLDLQHMRHSYKIINEHHNRTVYDKIKDIEAQLPGYSMSHRKFVGASYHPRWWEEIRKDRSDNLDYLLDNLKEAIHVVHTAGNYESRSPEKVQIEDETQGRIIYKARNDPLIPKILDNRKAVKMLLDKKMSLPIIIEDQTPGVFSDHLCSAEALRSYIKEEDKKGLIGGIDNEPKRTS